MKTHSVTMYTLEEGDELYYVRNDEIKKLVIKRDHLEQTDLIGHMSAESKKYINDRIIKPLLGNIYIKAGEKVRQSENGRLILWKKKFVKEIDEITRRPKYTDLTTIYEEVESDFAVSPDLLKIDSSAERIVQLSDLFKDIRIVVLYFKDTHRQIGAMPIAEFLTLHPKDAKNMIENQGIEAVAVKFDGSEENYDAVLRSIASRCE